MQFVVKRSEWYRGKGPFASMLLRKDGMKCCIGFVGQQCGNPDSKLMSRRTVWSSLTYGLKTIWPKWMTELETVNNDISSAYSVNDDLTITDTERESELAEIFKHNGDEIVFVD